MLATAVMNLVQNALKFTRPATTVILRVRVTSDRLRQTLLSDAAVEVLLDYAQSDEATWDSEVWRACLELLPARSPQRAAVAARLTRIEADLRR